MSNLLDLNIRVKELILQNDHQEANTLITLVSNPETRILFEFDLLVQQGRFYQLKDQVLQVLRHVRHYNRQFVHKILYYRALIHLFEGETTKALVLTIQNQIDLISDDIDEKSKEELFLQLTLLEADIRSNLGEHSRSLSLYYSILNEDEIFPYQACIALNGIGSALRILGKYQDAVKYLLKCNTIAKNNKITKYQGFAMRNLGLLYFNLGDFKEARLFLNRADPIFNSIKLLKERIIIIVALILLSLRENRLNQAVKHNNDLIDLIALLEEYPSELDLPFLQLFGDGILRSYDHTLPSLDETIHYFDEIIGLSTVKWIEIISIFTQTQLLIFKFLKTNNQSEVFKIMTNLSTLLQTVKSQMDHPLTIAIIILQSKFHMILSDYLSSKNTLDQGIKFALDNNLENFVPILEQELKKISKFYVDWKLMDQNELSIKKRSFHLNLGQYLDEITNLII